MRGGSAAACVAALGGVRAIGASAAIVTASAAADTPAKTQLAGVVAPQAADESGVTVSGTDSHAIELWTDGHQQAAQRFVVDAVSTLGSFNYHRVLRSPRPVTTR
jgi:hypothetical protein